MTLFLRRLRPGHLLLAWGAYWLGLALVTLGRPALQVWRMSRREGAEGNVTAGIEDAVATLNVAVDGATTWSGSASVPVILFWLVGPPLLLWALWLLLHRRAEARGPAAVGVGSPAPALQAPVATELDRGRDPAATPVGRDRAP